MPRQHQSYDRLFEDSWRSRRSLAGGRGSNAPAMMSNMLRPAGKVTICFIFLRVRLTERETDALSVQTASI